MLYLALSCLQGRPMADAARALLELAEPGRLGIQLTPGCAPQPMDLDCEARTHHGFTPLALRARVWDGGELVWTGDSVHPPLRRHVADDWRAPDGLVMETMYPGYAALSCGDELDAAMDRGQPLAVDVAHLGIQVHAGVTTRATLQRVLQYPHVAEVHVSTSHDGKDTHARIGDETWGVEWARDQLRAGTPVILECYMHKLDDAERRRQVELLLT